jgi:iron complex transport system substrate-binding protein
MTGRRTSALLLAAVTCLSCQGEAPSGAPPSAKSEGTSGAAASGAPAASTAAPKAAADRIVVVGAPITEIVYALGFGDKVIAVDLSSAYPPEAASKPRVGYQRTLAAEAILSQKPGMLLLAAESGPPSAIEQLRGTGVPMHVIPSEDSLAGAERKIREVASVLAAPDGGEALVGKLQAEAAASKALLARVKSKPKVVFIYSRAPGALMVAGRNTPADAMITLAGGENPITGYEGFKALTAESLTAAAPDVLLVPEHSLASLGGVAGVVGQPGAALTPAGRNGKVVAMEDALVIGFGPRSGAAIGTLARRIHPELATAPPDR